MYLAARYFHSSPDSVDTGVVSRKRTCECREGASRQIYDLAAGDCVRQHRDVLLIGPPGVGKSHLAQAIGQAAIRAGFLVVWTARSLIWYANYWLIIDDMGLKQLLPKKRRDLMEIILRRYENRSTFMTSNRRIEEWGKLLGDVPAATAILDRLLHHAEIIPIQGRSKRLKDGAAEKKEDKK